MIPDSVTLVLFIGGFLGFFMYLGGSFDWFDEL